MSNNENKQINEEAEKEFLAAKKQFQPFSTIDSIPEDKIESDLPVFTEDENAQRVLKAMERLYGEENVIHDILGDDPQFKPTGSNKTPKKKKKKKKRK